jgi:tetratricopeptide (TPR) repeat protein
MAGGKRSIGVALFTALLMAVMHGPVHAACGNIIEDAGNFGPFDYRDPAHQAKRLPLVENTHFRPEHENLSPDRNTRHLATNIGYTLRKFPNHHRALDAMSRLAVREGTPQPEGSRYTVDCWFQRAVMFQLRDGTVRMLYGVHLSRLGRYEEAIEHMLAGLRVQPDDPRIQYQVGLMYLEIGDYDNAREYARLAYTADFPLTELRDRLAGAGRWEP